MFDAVLLKVLTSQADDYPDITLIIFIVKTAKRMVSLAHKTFVHHKIL